MRKLNSRPFGGGAKKNVVSKLSTRYTTFNTSFDKQSDVFEGRVFNVSSKNDISQIDTINNSKFCSANATTGGFIDNLVDYVFGVSLTQDGVPQHIAYVECDYVE